MKVPRVRYGVVRYTIDFVPGDILIWEGSTLADLKMEYKVSKKKERKKIYKSRSYRL